MGKQVQELLTLPQHSDWFLKAVCSRESILSYSTESVHPKKYPLSTLTHVLKECDLLLDFSQADALPFLLDTLEDFPGLPVVSGVTGLDEQTLHRFQTRSQTAPTLYAPNFSFGVAITKKLVQLASQWLEGEYEVEIYELHHRYKKDAPSGTALALGQAVRDGDSKTPLQISAGRGGHVIGDHQVHFLGDHDRIEITHRALDRSLFAQGALRASRWLLNQPKGWYTLDDLL